MAVLNKINNSMHKIIPSLYLQILEKLNIFFVLIGDFIKFTIFTSEFASLFGGAFVGRVNSNNLFNQNSFWAKIFSGSGTWDSGFGIQDLGLGIWGLDSF